MAIPQKFRLTFWQGNYLQSFTYGFGVVVRDLGEWRPGFYSELRYKSRGHSGLAWEAILGKMTKHEENLFFFKNGHVQKSRNANF